MTTANATAISRILAKLADVRRREIPGFGWESHRYQLKPPLAEPSVAAFEAEHGVHLPEGYRQFLIEAGNGGAGPYYGLLSLDQWDQARIDDGVGEFLARPSPLRPGLPALESWASALQCTRDELFQGTLNIVHQGCTYETLLIVSGPHRGRVVYADLNLDGTPQFMRDADFLAWYERWLDELLWGFDTSWFGFGLPGNERDMATALCVPGQAPDVLLDALVTLGRLPALEGHTVEMIRGLVASPAAEVRSRAVGMLVRHHHADAYALAIAALRDVASVVRETGVRTVATIATEGWDAAVRPLLRDSDPDVRRRALQALKNAYKLTSADLQPLLGSTVAADRRHGLWASRGLGATVSPEVARLMSDPDPQVRRDAVMAIRDLPPNAIMAPLVDRLRAEEDAQTICILVQSLGKAIHMVPIGLLLKLADHPDAFVRLDVARALGRVGGPDAVASLERLATDETKPVRQGDNGIVVSNVNTVAEVARKGLASLGLAQGEQR